VAKDLYKQAKNIISKYEKNIEHFNWIEPSAGNGAFFKLLPKNNRTGLDIKPLNDEIVKQDYLKYGLPKNKKNIVLGNPPFGHRGVMALNFINHSKNADYVCFILQCFLQAVAKAQ